MKTKTITTKFILFLFLFSILFSCQTEDLNSELELQNSEVKFAIDDSGKILENIPSEILTLMIEEFELSEERNKIEILKNTYDLNTGNLTKLAIDSEIYLEKQNEYLNKSLSSRSNYYGYRAHVSGIGWLPWTPYGQVIGTTGQSRQLEAIEFGSVPSPICTPAISHLAGIGWYNQPCGSRIIGTTGQSRRMEAIRTNLAGYYRAYVAGIGWLPWVGRNQVAGTTGQGRRMEAFQLLSFSY